jgi:nucleoside-diphosphate-sugar epimerase
MRVLITGASGHIGSALIPELLAAGHDVEGLARSNHSAAVVRSLGADVCRGDLDDLDGLTAAARRADGVIHLAFKNEEMRAGDLAGAAAADLRAIEAMGSALKETGKPFIGTAATLGLVLAGFRGRLSERDTWPGGPRIDAENTVIALAEHGVRSAVVRLPPTVHGNGRYGFVSGLMRIAETTGASGYVGGGDNRWPAVDVRDAARLYRLALEAAPAGSRLHAVAEEGIALRDVATAIGRRLGVPTTSVPPENIERHFTYLKGFIALDNPATSRITRETLGWNPERPGLIAAIEQDSTTSTD